MNQYIITGSSRGLGKALVNVILQNSENRVRGISRSNDLIHPRFTHLQIDLNRPPDLIQQLDSIFNLEDDLEKVVLINNAGYLGPVKYLGDIEEDEFIRIYHVNLAAPAILSNAFIRRNRNRQGKNILLNISSGAAKSPYDGWSGYCSSKAGLDMLSKVAAMENEKREGNIRVISLAPGVIDTSMQLQIRNTAPEDFSSVERFHVLKVNNQLLSPEKAARQIVQFLEEVDKHPEVIQDIRDLNY
jgi:benzil reductase ((S)-benzoin forming)